VIVVVAHRAACDPQRGEGLAKPFVVIVFARGVRCWRAAQLGFSSHADYASSVPRGRTVVDVR
jgi:hypothetical protein